MTIIRIDRTALERFYDAALSLAAELQALGGATESLQGAAAALAQRAEHYGVALPRAPHVLVHGSATCSSGAAKEIQRLATLLRDHVSGADVLHADWSLRDLGISGSLRAAWSSAWTGGGTFAKSAVFGADRSQRRNDAVDARMPWLSRAPESIPLLGTLSGPRDLAQWGLSGRIDRWEDNLERVARRHGAGAPYERLEDAFEHLGPETKAGHLVSGAFVVTDVYQLARQDVPNAIDSTMRFRDASFADERLVAGTDFVFDAAKIAELHPEAFPFARALTSGMATGEAMSDAFEQSATNQLSSAEDRALSDLLGELDAVTPIASYRAIVDENALIAERQQVASP